MTRNQLRDSDDAVTALILRRPIAAIVGILAVGTLFGGVLFLAAGIDWAAPVGIAVAVVASAAALVVATNPR